MTTMGRLLHHLFSGERADSNSTPPYLLKFRSSKAFILTTICLAVFTDIFLYGIVVPVLPFSISERANVPQSEVQRWISVLLAVYGGALLVASPLTGWLADKSSSRRLPLLLGLVCLGGSTIMLCLARNISLLVVGRIFQGLSAAIVWTVGTALLVDTVGHAEIGQTLGWVSLSMSLGFLLAPLIGGVVYDRVNYYAVFYMAFGLITLDIILRVLLIEKRIARQWEAATEPRGISDAAEKAIGVNPAGEEPHRSLPISPDLQSAPSKYPAVITLLTSRRLLTALWGCVVQGSLLTAFDSVIPLFVERVFGWGPTAAGLSFLAIVLPNFIAPLVGWASDNYGPRWITVFGFMFAIPFWVLLRLVTYNSLSQKVLFLALLSLIGLALTLVLPPLMAEITYIVEAKEKERPGIYGEKGAYAQAYGLFIAAFAAGSLIGPLMGGYIEDSAGWGTMTWTLALLSFAGGVPCLIWTGGLITQVNARNAAERAMGRAALESAQAGREGAVV